MRCSQHLGAQDVTSGGIARFLALDIAVGALADDVVPANWCFRIELQELVPRPDVAGK